MLPLHWNVAQIGPTATLIIDNDNYTTNSTYYRHSNNNNGHDGDSDDIVQYSNTLLIRKKEIQLSAIDKLLIKQANQK